MSKYLSRVNLELALNFGKYGKYDQTNDVLFTECLSHT